MSRAEQEARLLASLPSIDAFYTMEQRGVTADSFQHFEAMYRFIAQVVEENQHLPRLRDLMDTFNVPEGVSRKPEEFDFLLTEFVRTDVAKRVQTILDSSISQHSEDPENMVDDLIKELSAIAVSDQRYMSITDQATAKRIVSRKQMKEGLIQGMPTGIGFFDVDVQLGWMPGELVGLVGRTYTGKTWILMQFGLLAWKAGFRVLFLSPELSVDEAEARWDTLLYGLHDIKVDINEIYRGYKPSKEMTALAVEAAATSSWVTLTSVKGKPFSLGEIPRLIRQHKPDLVLVDGLSLIRSSAKGQTWEKILDLSYGMKSIAIGSNVVIITSHQANRSAHNSARPPGLHEIAYGDAFVQACDRLLAISRPNLPNTLRITVQKFRKGEPDAGGTDFMFDPSKGRIYELNTQPTDGYGDHGADEPGEDGATGGLPIP